MYIDGGTSTFTSCEISSNTGYIVSAPLAFLPYPRPPWMLPDERQALLCLCSPCAQGGGMYIYRSNAQVTVTNSEINGNAASGSVSAPLLPDPSPLG